MVINRVRMLCFFRFMLVEFVVYRQFRLGIHVLRSFPIPLHRLYTFPFAVVFVLRARAHFQFECEAFSKRRKAQSKSKNKMKEKNGMLRICVSRLNENQINSIITNFACNHFYLRGFSLKKKIMHSYKWKQTEKIILKYSIYDLCAVCYNLTAIHYIY